MAAAQMVDLISCSAKYFFLGGSLKQNEGMIQGWWWWKKICDLQAFKMISFWCFFEYKISFWCWRDWRFAALNNSVIHDFKIFKDTILQLCHMGLCRNLMIFFSNLWFVGLTLDDYSMLKWAFWHILTEPWTGRVANRAFWLGRKPCACANS